MDAKIIDEIFKNFDADLAVFPELGGFQKGSAPDQRLVCLFQKSSVDYDNYEVFVSPETEGNIAPVTVVIKKISDNMHSAMKKE